MVGDVRRSVISGSWYPGNPGTLRTEIEGYLRNVDVGPVQGFPLALIAPHAGYVYSGQVAAYAYSQIEGMSYDAVFVIGPSHRVPFRGVSVYPRGGYETPLGLIPVADSLAESVMAESHLISHVSSAHIQEHSLEIQLPFLQVLLGSFRLVPLVMGSQDRATCVELADAICSASKGLNVLVVGSSDLSHFHEYESALERDSKVLEHIEAMDVEGLLNALGSGGCEACGGGPMAVSMLVAGKKCASGVRVLKYANSGDVTGDRHSVVGYASVVIFREEDRVGTEKTENPDLVEKGLTREEKRVLLKLARETISARLAGKKPPYFDGVPDALRLPRGAFVTLKKRGRLRGCIGYIESRKPLFEAVDEMARAAAFDDPRFPSLRGQELKDIAIEISALSPLKRIKDIEEIEVGTHGIYFVRGPNSGLLLPQVATEYGWDRKRFIEETCRKAGLGPDAWKGEDSEIYIFSAEVFGEE